MVGIIRTTRIIPHTTFAAFTAAAPDEGLLSGETDGLAIDFTDTTFFNLDTDSQLWNQVRTSSVDVYSSPHVFYTNSGTSPKVVKTSATGLGWSPHNMFLNSDATATQDVTLVTGFQYTYGITGAGTLTGSSGASGAATAGNPVTFTATGTTGTFTVSGGTPTTMQINRGTSLTTYLSTVGSIVIGLPISYGEGLWVEPAATNMCLRSEDLTTTWTNVTSTETVDATTAPDGSTADRLNASAGSGTHLIAQSITTVALTTYTASCFMKSAGTAQFAQIIFVSNTSSTIWIAAVVDVVNGTITETANGAGGTLVGATITSVGNGWYRVTLTGSGNETNTAVEIQIVDSGTPTQGGFGEVTWTAAGTEQVYIWGAQLETGTIATSYIPTVAATVTRAADDVECLTSSFPFSATAGTVYIDYSVSVTSFVSGASYLVWQIDNNTENERIFVDGFTDASINAEVVDGNVSQSDILTTEPAAHLRYQISHAWAANDFDASFDGAAVQSDPSGTLPTVTTLHLGARGLDQSVNLNGFLYRLIYVPRQVQTGTANLQTWRYNF